MFGMGMLGGGGGGGGAGNDVSQGAMAAFQPTAPNFAPTPYQPAPANPALAPKPNQTAAQQGQPDQLTAMINKLLGAWVDREKAQTQATETAQGAQQGQSPQQAAGPVDQTNDAGWGPYSVSTPQALQHWFQPGASANG